MKYVYALKQLVEQEKIYQAYLLKNKAGGLQKNALTFLEESLGAFFKESSLNKKVDLWNLCFQI